MPGNVTVFADLVAKETKLSVEKLRQGQIHFRQWMFALVFGDEVTYRAIGKLRDALGRNYENYCWFSRQVQMIFEIFSDKVHASRPEFLKRKDFLSYTDIYTTEMREAVEKFVKSIYFN